VIGREQELYSRAACDVTGGSGAVRLGMNTLLVQMFVMSQGSEPVIGQEQELACRAACYVSGCSGATEVGTDSWLVQELVISQGA